MGKVARLTGLEPATPGVTGRYSNQLSYNRVEGEIVQVPVGVNGRIQGQTKTAPPVWKGRFPSWADR